MSGPRASLLTFRPAAAAAAGLFALKLASSWLSLGETPSFFYHDSSSHALHRYWSGTGLGVFYRLAAGAGLDLPHGVWAVNALLAAAALGLVYDAARRLDGRLAGFFAAALAVSVPPFGRLAFSGQPETAALALDSLGFWLAARGAGRTDRRGFALQFAAVGALGLAVFSRAEALGFLLAGGGLLAWKWREKPRAAAVLAAWWLFWVFVRLDAVWSHGAAAAHQGGPPEYDLWWRASRVPVWLGWDLFPLTLFLLPLAAAFRAEPGLRWIARTVAAQALLMWAASALFLLSWETERNLCAAAFWAMAPAGVMAARWYRGLNAPSRRVARGGAFLLLAWSWVASHASAPEFARDNPDRRAGRALRVLEREGRLGPPDALVLYEAAGRDWPNAAALSGIPDRVRLLPTVDVEWGRSRVWDGGGPVGAVVTHTDEGEGLVRENFRVLALVADHGEYRIFRAGPPEGPRPAGAP
jgi:hypothetical protein